MRHTMQTDSTITKKLAAIGIQIPPKLKSYELDQQAGNWIQEGHAYAEEVFLLRMQLNKASETSRIAANQLFLDLENEVQENPWDHWMHSAIHHEVKRFYPLDRWKHSIELLRDSQLTKAQIMGAMLALADAQQLAGAAVGAMRLLEERELDVEEALRICAIWVTRSDISWRMDEAGKCPKAYEKLTEIHLEYCRLLLTALKHYETGLECTNSSSNKRITSSIEVLINLLGKDDQWIGIPKSLTAQKLKNLGTVSALAFLEQNLSKSSGCPEAGRAGILLLNLLIESGRKEDAQSLCEQAIKQLEQSTHNKIVAGSRIEDIRTKDESRPDEIMITHEKDAQETSDISLGIERQDELSFRIGLSAISYAKYTSYSKISQLYEADLKVFSQYGEDGIIDFLTTKLNLAKPTFIEIGTGDYSESNTRFLFQRTNTRGKIVDCDKLLEQKARAVLGEYFWKGDLTIASSFITLDNILDILLAEGRWLDCDILSLDIDGNDYWLMKKIISMCSHKIIILEYNPTYGGSMSVSTPYIEDFNRTQYHYSNLCWGASLKAFVNLMDSNGYIFAGTNLNNSNGFWIRGDLFSALGIASPDRNNLCFYTKNNCRESRSLSGELTFLSGASKLDAIRECLLVDLEDNETKKKAEDIYSL